MEILSEMDCKKFGHLRLNEEANLRKRKVALKAVAFLEHSLSTAGATAATSLADSSKMRKRRKVDPLQQDNSLDEDEDAADDVLLPQDPKAYRKLGHLHLLLENYNKALSAYEKYSQLAEGDCDEDVDYLYGKGLVYFHFNAFHLSARALQQVLYLNPCYERATDVHAR
jgi:histone demethylase